MRHRIVTNMGSYESNSLQFKNESNLSQNRFLEIELREGARGGSIQYSLFFNVYAGRTF